MEENSPCLSQPSVRWLPCGAASVDPCPRGDSAEPQAGCVCRAQLRARLRHKGRFPFQQHRLQQQQPWEKPQSQLVRREHDNQALGTGGHKAALPQTWTHSLRKRCWGIPTQGIHVHQQCLPSPVPCCPQGWAMCIPREVPLPWQPQLHDTALFEASGSAHSGHREEAALPHSESHHSHQVAHKIFSFFFIEITIKN